MFYMPVNVKRAEAIDEIEMHEQALIICSKRMLTSSSFFENKEILVYDEYFSNEPDLVSLDRALEKVRSLRPKVIVGIGGGSVLDVAKILAVLTNDSAREIFVKKEIKDRLPLVLIPTTAGTGSEVTSISIMADHEFETKIGISHPKLFADEAYLIPSLLRGMPNHVMMASAIDAWIHAFESFFSKNSNPLTEYQSLQAISLMTGVLDKCRLKVEPSDDVLFDMLMASTIAGIAFANAGTGAVHAMSYPLGGKYHVPHGEANCQCLMPVVARYLQEGGRKVDVFNQVVQQVLGQGDVVDLLTNLMGECLPLKPMRHYGVTEKDLEDFVDIVETKQTRLTKNNYIAFNRNDYLAMYKERY